VLFFEFFPAVVMIISLVIGIHRYMSERRSDRDR
jgi:hypothetical protein